MANDIAPPGHVFVCGACGKVSTTRYGFDRNGRTSSRGWGELCFMNCGLVEIVKIVEPVGWQFPRRVRKVGP